MPGRQLRTSNHVKREGQMNHRSLTALTILLLLMLAGLMAGASRNTSAAATLIVDDDLSCAGATHASIQAAVNAAAPGDTVRVCPGTYAETVTINKTLTLLGARNGVDARTRAAAPGQESVVD